MTLLPCSPCCPCPSLRIRGPIPVWPWFGEQVPIASIDVDISFNEMEDSFYVQNLRECGDWTPGLPYSAGPSGWRPSSRNALTRAAFIRRPRSGVYSLTWDDSELSESRFFSYTGERISMNAVVPTADEINSSPCGAGYQIFPLFELGIAFNEIRLASRACPPRYSFANFITCPVCDFNQPTPSLITRQEIEPPAGTLFNAGNYTTNMWGGFSFSQECRSKSSDTCEVQSDHVLKTYPQGSVSALISFMGLSALPGGTASWSAGGFPIVAQCPGFSGVPAFASDCSCSYYYSMTPEDRELTGPPPGSFLSESLEGSPFDATTTVTVNSITVVYSNGTTRSVLS